MQCNLDAIPHDAMQKGLDCEFFTDPVYFMLKFSKSVKYSHFHPLACVCFFWQERVCVSRRIRVRSNGPLVERSTYRFKIGYPFPGSSYTPPLVGLIILQSPSSLLQDHRCLSSLQSSCGSKSPYQIAQRVFFWSNLSEPKF
jgi:hypothetical protein